MAATLKRLVHARKGRREPALRVARRRWWNRSIGAGLTALLIIAGTAEVVTVRTAYGVRVAEGRAAYDPVAFAEASIGRTVNYEAVVPAMCYTKTGGVSNACYVCHAVSAWPNQMDDYALQEEYAFSDFALTNHWSNLFEDRQSEIAAIGDAEALAYVREDNYAALREALVAHTTYPGYVPDLDFDRGFDELGFARDGSGWRALRYKPFVGTFWPTNGSADDVFIRLPEEFRTTGDGNPSIDIYRVNLSILEAAMTGDPEQPVAGWARQTEPLDELAAAIDLDGDGKVGGVATLIRGLPSHFAGAAGGVPVTHARYPAGVEFLHTVRYLDPDRPGFIARRMKEVRYSRKVRFLDTWAIGRVYEEELNEKADGVLPKFAGSPRVGLRNGFGWQLQGFIEDPAGRLRLQTEEEHRWCMGCHGTIGVTVDSTFTLTRKVPGLAGWAYQNPHGIADVPPARSETPEYALYLQRVRGGDEFRANDEMVERFITADGIDTARVARAAPGGAGDITDLILPSRERAILLDKAYLALVRSRDAAGFAGGRDTMPAPPQNVHRRIENGSTDLARTGMVFRDGTLHLAWNGLPDGGQ